MHHLMENISKVVENVFLECKYDKKFGKVTLSNRPDLCQFQCNGALAASKVYGKKPFDIAQEIAVLLKENSYFKEITVVMPGFINMILNDQVMIDYLIQMGNHNHLGCEKIGEGKKIIIDYGGPNIAKPLHVGHLRTAIIGESLKRIGRYLGYHIIGDVHLGDWGLQIGLIIAELKRLHPEWIYFDLEYIGEYPKEPPFTISELEKIYPQASSYAKINPEFMKEAKELTFQFQNGVKGFVALWEHILNVSITDLKKNYSNLNVSFDLWKKESDAQPYIPDMISHLKEKGLAYISEGALVVDVKKEDDTKEIPPCIIVKSDGATLYSTTDLATIVERMALYDPDELIYIVDKRQEMHFEQVFRCAQKGKLVKDPTKLTFLGFGTMNGADGKPFKTRDGGVMRLEQLINEVKEKVYQKVKQNHSISDEEAEEITHKVSIAALKYGDLSNQIAKDYLFDLDRFTAFEGNTGPYILYTVVRINSILSNFLNQNGKEYVAPKYLNVPTHEVERQLMLKVTQFNEIIENSFIEYAPHKICQYIYELSNQFNRFYHETKILTEVDQSKQLSWIYLVSLVKEILVCALDLLGIEIPEKM